MIKVLEFFFFHLSFSWVRFLFFSILCSFSLILHRLRLCQFRRGRVRRGRCCHIVLETCQGAVIVIRLVCYNTFIVSENVPKGVNGGCCLLVLLLSCRWCSCAAACSAILTAANQVASRAQVLAATAAARPEHARRSE